MSCCGSANRDTAARANFAGQETSDRTLRVATNRLTTARTDRNLAEQAAAPREQIAEHVTRASPPTIRRATANRDLTTRAVGAFFMRADRRLLATSDRCAPEVDIAALLDALANYCNAYNSHFKDVVNWPIAPPCQ